MTDPRGAHGDPVASEVARRKRFARAKAIFLAAVELPEAGRAPAVAAACGPDAALRQDVESLLASDADDSRFLERPAAATMASRDPAPDADPRLPPGTCLGVYVVEALLGRGGMGEVYLARDTRLRRRVAIKIVGDVEAGRRADAALLREARHASALSHPCICTVHEVGEHDGRPFIVMEHVEGETLRAMVAREGRLPEPDLLRRGACIADALAHAHARGLVHRDLKSANVMVSRGGATKVLDFGLARWLPSAEVREATASVATESLALAGTLDYMAPEVLLGGKADARSDIWSLGVLLYEMAAGTTPFHRESAADSASAILKADPPPLPRQVSLGLRLVTLRCLAREAAGRYQRAGEVRDALEALRIRGGARRRVVARLAWTHARPRLRATAFAVIALIAAGAWFALQAPASSVRPLRTLLVMPLAAESPTPDEAQRYFGDGLTEALIAAIGQTGVERVISRTTAMKARSSPRGPREIARELRVDAVLDGSASRNAGRVRLSVRLVEVTTGREFWSSSQERPARETASLVAATAAAVAAGMKHDTSEDASRRLLAVRAVAPDVYEAYLKGRYYWNQRTETSLRLAIEYYQSAIRMDPSYAPADAALADCYNQLGTVLVGTGSPARFRPLAAASAIKALQIDPGLSEAHATLGYVRHYDWQWRESEREFQEAIRLNPSNALAHIWYANLLASLRRIPEALREVERGRDLDPFSLVVNTNVGWTLGYAGRHDDAIRQYRTVLAMDPAYVQARLRLGGELRQAGRFKEALVEFQEVARLTHDAPAAETALAQTYTAMGRRPDALALLDSVLREARQRYVSPSSVANVYEALGRPDAAFAWLEDAYQERSNHLAYLAVDGHPGLRSDPRFAALLHRVGLE